MIDWLVFLAVQVFLLWLVYDAGKRRGRNQGRASLNAAGPRAHDRAYVSFRGPVPLRVSYEPPSCMRASGEDKGS